MRHNDTIEHDGTVVSVERGRVRVDVEVGEACGACASRRQCALGQASQHRSIEIAASDASSYSVGERVTVAVRKGAGIGAVIFGYVIPLAVLVAVLVACVCAGTTDGTAAIVSLAAVAVYYAALYAFRGKISEKITFTISKSKR